MHFEPKFIVILSILFITIFEGLAQSCLKKYNKEDLNLYIIVALFCYTLICFLLLQCYKNDAYMGHVNLIWSCLSIIFIIGVGCLVFGEKFTSDDLMGVILAIGAIYFVQR